MHLFSAGQLKFIGITNRATETTNKRLRAEGEKSAEKEREVL